MSYTPSSYLTDTQTNGNSVFKDWRHAADLFNADQFRLAPKKKYLFHVAFGINPACLRNPSLSSTYGQEINMMVKAVDLPNFTVQTEMLNQYNRKKIVQYQHKPGDIAIKFHDDNMGLINQVWQNYYSYYYADSTSAYTPGAYSRNATKEFSTIPTSYGLDAGSTVPFFNYIKIYQLARHEFICYQLWNPIIQTWNHNKLDYYQHVIHDFDMKIQFEAVSYSVGFIQADDPEGFGITHYDLTPSPLQPNSAVADPTALSNTAGGPSFVSSDTNNTNGIPAGTLSHAIAQINTYQNSQQSSSPLDSIGSALGITAGIAGVVGVGTSLLSNATGGLSGISFPGASTIGDAISSVGSAISDAASGIGDALGF
jgi:hypothetical protein